MKLRRNMRNEIATVVFFLKRLVKHGHKLDPEQVDVFFERLTVALQEKFKGHWYPDNPSKGQAYRCIRVNRFCGQDPVILRACRETGIKYDDLGLPQEFSLWVDPGEVYCRYLEHNPCFSVATFSTDEEENKDVMRKVTSALERVTSDYHSHSSSDEESSQCSPVTVSNSHCTSQALNPSAPSWTPKKQVQGKGHPPLRPQCSFRPRNNL